MSARDQSRRRGPVLTALAAVMCLLAISNFMKPVGQAMRPESSAGFVFFGQRLEGLANAVMGPLFGLVLLAYAYGVWTRKRWVVPLAVAYAAYVIVNLVLFTGNVPPGEELGVGFALAYSAVAIGVSAGGALYLYRNRRELA
jgi:hypothetical protein